MIRPDLEDSTVIVARDGRVLQCLSLQETGAKPVLIDAAGQVIAPWAMEVLRWPSAAEPALRRGGYLRFSQPELDLWCNCAD